MLKFFTTLCFCLVSIYGISQKFTVSGYVKDASNGEDVIGATISVKELEGTETATNVYGFYSLSLPKGSYTLTFTSIGFANVQKTIDLSKNVELSIELGASTEKLEKN